MARRSPSVPKQLRIVRYSGDSYTLLEGRRSPDGTVKAGPYEFAEDAAIPLAADLIVLPVDEPVLRSESDFHRMRRRVALSSLFVNGGDVMELVRNVGFGLTLVLLVVVWMQLNALSGSLGGLAGQTKAIQSQLSKPVQVQLNGTSTTANGVSK